MGAGGRLHFVSLPVLRILLRISSTEWHGSGWGQWPDGPVGCVQDGRYWRHFVPLSLLVWALPLGLAMALDDLGVALAVFGGTACTCVSYILPGAYYWAMAPGRKTAALAALLSLAGIAVVPLSIVSVLMR